MNKIKYLFSDIDGTLIFKNSCVDCIKIPEEERFISTQTLALLNEVKKQKIKLILVSGRRRRSYQRLKNIIPHDSVILEHGSLIILDNDQINQKYHSALEQSFQALREFRVFLENLGYEVDVSGRLGSFRVLKLNKKALSPEEKINIEKIIKNNEINFQVHSTRNGQMIDVLPLKVDKNSAIQFVLNEFQSSTSEAIFLGNDVNDISMFENAVYGACPFDANSKVKRLLIKNKNCYISPESNHKGITDILKKYILH